MANRDEPSIAPPRPLSAGVPGQGPADAGSLASRFRRDSADENPTTSQQVAADGSHQVRQAKLRLVQIEPWSVMKSAFLLSVAVAIVTVVAVAIVWGVLGAAGLWDSINSTVQDSVGNTNDAPFEIQKYLGTTRVLGFTMIVAVADVVLITAIATLGAFLYNLTATLVGGIEVTFAEDR